MSTAQSKTVWKFLFAALVVVLAMTGFSQQLRNSAPVQQTSVLLGVSPERVLILGAGVLGGAVGVSALLGGGAALSLAGGAAGALIGDWWYLQRLAQPGARKGGVATLAARP